MRSWNRPQVPRLAGSGPLPRLYDTATRQLRETAPNRGRAALYVCGITPYDATHLGHAATYLAYDTLIRLWLDAGCEVDYAQNVTDVDDPLLERATATGVDWRDLAAQQVELFRADMQSLSIIPPEHYVAVTETIAVVADAVSRLLELGVAYRLERDVYFDSAAAAAVSSWQLGQESGLGRVEMLQLSAERGGDPERPGKRDPLDPALWLAARPAEPSWPSVLGEGRPGWHIECSVIAQEFLRVPLTVAGGGRDLVFPHHEFTAGHTAALSGHSHAQLYSHTGLVAYRGQKMSKSLGNLVFVSALRLAGTDPRAIRLAILTQHYRDDWEWTSQLLDAAVARLGSWQTWAATAAAPPHTASITGQSTLTQQLRSILSEDLDTPGAVAAIDARVERGGAPTPAELDAIAALLGIRL